MIAYASQFALIGFALWGAYTDIRFRRLSNLLCLLTLIAGLAFGYALHDLQWVGLSLLHALAALVIGMLLFRFGIVGGGDAKYFAAFAAWLPVSLFFYQTLLISLAGVLVVLLSFTYRRLAGKPMAGMHSKDKSHTIPYGVAIAAGALLTHFTM